MTRATGAVVVAVTPKARRRYCRVACETRTPGATGRRERQLSPSGVKIYRCRSVFLRRLQKNRIVSFRLFGVNACRCVICCRGGGGGASHVRN
jgi:hypothetical protein